MKLPKLPSKIKQGEQRPDLLVIAGEHSGDLNASFWVKKLKQNKPNLKICAVGGENLAKAGAELLLDITNLSVVGLFEVLRHYRKFKALMKWLEKWIALYSPKCVCLVDFPGFNLRLAERLFKKGLSAKAGGKTKIYYYIAPQIWAWKAKRRFLMEKLIDGLGTIFPFEKEHFSDTKLPVTFVGHPLIDKKMPFSYDPDGPVLILPGSRKTEVNRIFPELARAFDCLRDWYRASEAVVVCPSKDLEKIIEKKLKAKILNRCKDKFSIVPFSLDMEELKVSSVIMSSGTASLMVALAGIPGIIAYKAKDMTAFVARMLIKVPYLGIANIILRKEAYPEFLQSRCTGYYIADGISEQMMTPEKTFEKFQKYKKGLREDLTKIPATPPEVWIEKAL